MKEVIIVGNGKLADVIENNFSTYSKIPVKKYKANIEVNKDSIFVHIGSGREYEESLKLAKLNGAAYIQAATEKDIKMKPITDNVIRFISAANLDLNIIKFFYWLKFASNLFKSEAISIIESHQEVKKSQAGTALKICENLNISKESIISIRDPEQQKKLNIKNLNHHAFHRIKIGDDDSSIIIDTKIEGAISYVKGLARIVECIPALENGFYEIDDLVKLKLL